MKELKSNVNTLLWLMVTLSVMMMFSLVCLSSCNSSVQNGKGGKTPNPGPETVKITVIAPKEGGSIKVNGEVLKETKEFTPKIGDTMAFEAVTNDGYKFKGWQPTTLGTAQTAKMTVTKDLKDLSVSVKFEKGNNPPGPGPSDTDFPFKITKDSPIVYKTSGLGFGKKKADPDGIYYAISDYEEGKDNGLVGDDLAGDNHPTGNKAPFTSIREGLEKRWNSYKTSYKDVVLYEGKNLVKMFNNGRYLILLKDNIINLYVYNENAYADYIVVFINKKEESDSSPDEIYLFNYNDDGKPYLLYDRKKISCQYSTPAPGFNPDSKDNLPGFRTLTLKSMFESFLEQQEKKKEGTKEQIRSKFSPLIPGNEDKYETYIIVRQNNDRGKPYGHPMLCWRNVLKFDDPFWAENQTQP